MSSMNSPDYSGFRLFNRRYHVRSLRRLSPEDNSSPVNLPVPEDLGRAAVILPIHAASNSLDSATTEDMSEEATNSSSTATASSPTSSTRTQSSRMENGEKLPILASGLFHRKPQPILSVLNPPPAAQPSATTFPPPDLPHPSDCIPLEMRPPPKWLPPEPPTTCQLAADRFESNYEDPEDINRNNQHEATRAFLLATSPGKSTDHSYEMSLSKQRMSAEMLDPADWSHSNERVLHKNAEGHYFIPPSSVRTSTSNVSPSTSRYLEQCNAVPRQLRVSYNEGASTTLLKPPSSSLTYPQKRRSKMSTISETKKPNNSECHSPFSKCTMFLVAALAIAILIIAYLLLRGPSYVYSEQLPTAGNSPTPSFDVASLRPLPTAINLGQRVEADIQPKHLATTEIFIPTASRILFNVTLGGSAQLVLLSRHFVPPTLAYHDFLLPLRAEAPATTYKILERKARRHVNTASQLSVAHEQFMLAGKHYLTIVNDRNRVEPLSLFVSSIPSSQTSNGNEIASSPTSCLHNCNSHGECVDGVCKCVPSYKGQFCEEAVCPVLCSGNGVFSGGVCLCYSGYKGKECDLRANWCEVADCNGHGRCTADGVCACEPEWTGEACDRRACPHPSCNDRGICSDDGRCYCSDGWTGSDCSIFVDLHTEERVTKATQASALQSERRSNEITRKSEEKQDNKCNNHGLWTNEICHCSNGWKGATCAEEDCGLCENGRCRDAECRCFAGWSGKSCNLKTCPIGCELNGKCREDGTCKCNRGWNGENCQEEGCPLNCGGNGECLLSDGKWMCLCASGKTASDCGISIELEEQCEDGTDNDNDGLTDCDDPECCLAEYCRQEAFCQASISPTDVLLRLPTVRNAEFYERVQFLIRNDSVQSYAESKQYEPSMTSVVRGRVMWRGARRKETISSSNDYLPLLGVRVSDANHPLYGFTLSRADGYFDLLVNGGRSLTLVFLRNQFHKERRTVYVRPNELILLEDIVMSSDKEQPISSLPARPNCAPSTRKLPDITLRPAWQFQSPTSSLPRQFRISSNRALVESLQLVDSSVHLIYDSSRIIPSLLLLNLLDSTPDDNLRLIHLKIRIAGREFNENLAPRVNLTHIFEWDRQNAYRQIEHGLTRAEVAIGYEYQDCNRDKEIVWIQREVKMQGGVSRNLEASAWTLDIHHHLDTVNSILEYGNGDVKFVREQQKVGTTVLGSKQRREMECSNECNGPANEALLFRPTALAHGLDGSLLVGDHSLIRRISPASDRINTILSLSLADTSHQYYLAVHPIDGSLFISLPLRKQIWKVTNFETEQVQNNYEVVAGDGSACVGVSDSCGDGGVASQAQLFFPKGIAFDRNGNLYVADGRRLRVIDPSGYIRSINDVSPEGPSACDTAYFASSIGNLKLEWPTSITMHMPSGLLHVLDSSIVYELDLEQDTSKVLLGVFPTCPNSTNFAIKNVKDIAASPNGALYIVESDGKKINQVRVLSSDRSSLKLLAGGVTACGCDSPACICDETQGKSESSASSLQFNSPSAISIDPKGKVFVADSGNAKIKKLYDKTFDYNPDKREYSWIDADTNELFVFNRHGQHVSTQSLISGRVIYNFTYDVETSLGRLTSIHGAGGLLLRVMRANESHIEMESPSGQRTHLTLDPYEQTLTSFQIANEEPIKLVYTSTGLLIMKTQKGRETFHYEYDKFGRVIKILKDGEIWHFEDGGVQNERVFTQIRKNGKRHALWMSRPDEESYYREDGLWSRAAFMDEGMQLTGPNITSVLHESDSQLHGQKAISKKRTTIAAIQNPNRRVLSTKWDWKYGTKSDGQRRVAEVGTRKMVNGVNVYTLVYHRENNSESVLARNDESLFDVEYSEYGNIKRIWQPFDDEEVGKVAPLIINYDSLGRRSEIAWGERKLNEKHDGQNRLIERSQEDGDISKFTYSKSLRTPELIDYNGRKYNLKYDIRGELREVVTPSGEIHSFSRTPIGDGISVLKRRYPYTKKPFMLAVDESGAIVEWMSSDEQQHWIVETDEFGRQNRIFENGVQSIASCWQADGHALCLKSKDFSTSSILQGPLVVLQENIQTVNERTISSSFAYEYDDLLRCLSVRPMIDGAALEAIQMSYDEKYGTLSSIAGFEIARRGSTQTIQGQKLLYETIFDKYQEPLEKRISMGDTRIVCNMKKSPSGRVTEEVWTTSLGDKVKKIEYSQDGKVHRIEQGEKTYRLTYSEDGLLTSMNDVVIEYHPGGVIKRAANNYTLDANGWVLKRGETLFSYGAHGQLIWARSGSKTWQFGYDNKQRLISINQNGAITYLFYGLPNLPNCISHFLHAGSQSISTIFYTEHGIPFSALHNGYRYAVVLNSDNSLRYLLSENGIEKSLEYGPLGRIVHDTAPQLWLPLGYRQGIDIPELQIAILSSNRPLDVTIGRLISFSPRSLFTILDCPDSLDLFSSNFEKSCSSTKPMPIDFTSWLSLTGFSSSLIPSPTLDTLSPAHFVTPPLFISLYSRFSQFDRLSSLRSSALLGYSTLSSPFGKPVWSLEDPTFSHLFLLDTTSNKTTVIPTPSLSEDETRILKELLEGNTIEINWPIFSSGRERHFVRTDSIPHSITSSAHPQFTVVVSKKTVEVRSNKAKIIAHFETTKGTVERELIEELKKKEARTVWSSEKRAVERGEPTKSRWADTQKRELTSRGSIRGYGIQWAWPQTSSSIPRFSSIYLWQFVESP